MTNRLILEFQLPRAIPDDFAVEDLARRFRDLVMEAARAVVSHADGHETVLKDRERVPESAAGRALSQED